MKKGEVVELFLIAEGLNGMDGENYGLDSTSAMHLHGYAFYVVAMERHGKANSNVTIKHEDAHPRGMKNLN